MQASDHSPSFSGASNHSLLHLSASVERSITSPLRPQTGSTGLLLRRSVDGSIMVAGMTPNGPADMSRRIVLHDILLQVDGKNVEALAPDDVSSLLVGSPGTQVQILLYRPSSSTQRYVSVQLTRALLVERALSDSGGQVVKILESASLLLLRTRTRRQMISCFTKWMMQCRLEVMNRANDARVHEYAESSSRLFESFRHKVLSTKTQRTSLSLVQTFVDGWKTYTDRKETISNRALQLLLKLSLGYYQFAFVQWKQVSIVLKRTRRVIKRLHSRSFASAFQAWASNASSQREARHRCRRVIQRMLQGKVAGAFEAWVHGAAESRRVRTSLQRLCGRWRSYGLVKAFG
eukprot:765536-Hanusia_phi.AAC.1